MEFKFQNMRLQCYKLEKLITSKICSRLLVFHELWIKADHFFGLYKFTDEVSLVWKKNQTRKS